MYTLKYGLLLTLGMYAGSSFAAATTWQRVPKKGLIPQTSSPTFKRPYTSTPRVIPTWLQPEIAQQALLRTPSLTEQTNRPLLVQKTSYKEDSHDTFWDRYQKYGLMAAITGLFGSTAYTPEMSADEKKIDELEKISDLAWQKFTSCANPLDQLLELNLRETAPHSAQETLRLRQIEEKMSIECSNLLYKSYAADIDLLVEAIKSDSTSSDEVGRYKYIIENLKRRKELIGYSDDGNQRKHKNYLSKLLSKLIGKD
jgi:hypothetical protein